MSDKREHILSVAEELFGEKGFDGTSVRDIAQSAGVNLAMISYYFGSKEKLLESLIEFRTGYAYGILEELNKDEIPQPLGQDRPAGGILCRQDPQQSPVSQYHVPGELPTPGPTRSGTRSSRIKMRNLEQITKIITDGQQKKLFRQVDIPMTVGYHHGHDLLLYPIQSIRLPDPCPQDDTNDEEYRAKLAPRLKAHLKQLLRAHLDIRTN